MRDGPHRPVLRPALRAVETVVVPDPDHGQVLVLRDTQGVTNQHAVLPPALIPIVSRFTGQATCATIAREASAELGVEVSESLVQRLAAELDRALFLDSPTFHRAREKVEREFREASVRPAAHAGGAYHGDGESLRAYLEMDCLGASRAGRKKAARPPASALGLIAPHIDPWRGAVSYGHAYDALAAHLPAEVDTFIVFGTSHAPMREAFALCKKSFATPLGAFEVDEEAVDRLATRARFDAYADLLNHKREHSLEFQAVFLKHLLKKREARIVPILAGLGAHQARGTNPASDPVAAGFLDAVRELIESRPGRCLVVAGADFAHVGPRFGDAAPFGAKKRATLERTDRQSLAHAAAVDADAFWEHVAADLDERRVCGLAPVYSLLRTLGAGADGEVLHYEQTVDPEEGSIVSHGAVLFSRATSEANDAVDGGASEESG